MCVFFIFISFFFFFFFFDEVSNFHNRILTNQRPELVMRNYLWNCMLIIAIYLCIHEKWSSWDYATWHSCNLHFSNISSRSLRDPVRTKNKDVNTFNHKITKLIWRESQLPDKNEVIRSSTCKLTENGVYIQFLSISSSTTFPF